MPLAVRLIVNGYFSKLSEQDKASIDQDIKILLNAVEVTNNRAILYLLAKYKLTDMFPDYVSKLEEGLELENA
jgi:hypothetical protein